MRKRPKKTRKKKITITSPDPDIRGSWPALKRAARNARKLSKVTGTPFYVVRGGRIIDLNRPRTPSTKGR